ncbi:MAG: TonB-dependent receptor [Gemmatimonadetes bacterium]|nr:TonB-dependent receptor [Gemmatimonadota bacterium]
MLRSAGVFALALAAAAAQLPAQDQRSIAGRVLSLSDSTPLASVQVTVSGGRFGLTDSSGTFTLDAPPGSIQIAIRRVGIVPDTVSVPAGQDSVVIYARLLAVPLGVVRVEAEVAPERARFDTLALPGIVTLSARDIARTPALLEPDVIRAIQLLPGTVARNDYSIGYNVRGGEADQNLVAVDGATVFNPSHLGGLFGTFDVNAIDRVDFMTSGFPATYPGRLSSILDINVRPGSTERWHGSGAITLLSSKLLLEGPVGPSSILVGARRTYVDQVIKAFSKEEFPYYFADAIGKVNLPYGSGSELSLTAFWDRDILDQNLIEGSEGVDPIDLRFHWGNSLAAANWRHRAGRTVFNQHLSYTEFSIGFGFPGLLELGNRARLWSGRTAATLTAGSHSIGLGGQFETYDLPFTISAAALGDSAFYRRNHQPRVWSAVLDDQWQVMPSLLVRGGVRGDRVPGASFTGLSPRASFKFFLTPDQALTGSAGRYHQVVQSARDQEVPLDIFEFWVGADRNVPVARSDHLVVGYERWLGAANQISIEAYRKTFDDLIAPREGFANRAPEDEFRPVRGNAWGIDLLLRRHAGTVRGWVAYSFGRAVRESEGLTYQPSHDRRHTLNIVVELPGPLHSEMALRWGLGSPLPYTPFIGEWRHTEYSPTRGRFVQPENEPLGGALNSARYPAYSRGDLGLRWRGHLWSVQWEPYLQVVNVYNRRNVFAHFYDFGSAPPRRTTLFQLPFLLSFGAEFSW